MFAQPGSRATDWVESIAVEELEWRVQEGILQLGELVFNECYQVPPPNFERTVPATRVTFRAGAMISLFEKPVRVRHRYPGVRTTWHDAWVAGYSTDDEGEIGACTASRRATFLPTDPTPSFGRAAEFRFRRPDRALPRSLSTRTVGNMR